MLVCRAAALDYESRTVAQVPQGLGVVWVLSWVGLGWVCLWVFVAAAGGDSLDGLQGGTCSCCHVAATQARQGGMTAVTAAGTVVLHWQNTV